MSLVENLINQISSKELGGITKLQGFDLNDNTFANLLENSINKLNPAQQIGINTNFGAPAGMIIEPYDETNPIEPVKPLDLYNHEMNTKIEIKDVEIGKDYLADLLKTSPDNHLSILNLAKKHASSAYNAFAKIFVENLGDLAKDAVSML